MSPKISRKCPKDCGKNVTKIYIKKPLIILHINRAHFFNWLNNSVTRKQKCDKTQKCIQLNINISNAVWDVKKIKSLYLNTAKIKMHFFKCNMLESRNDKYVVLP